MTTLYRPFDPRRLRVVGVDGLLVADFAAHSEESYRERLGDLWLGFELEEISRWLDEAEFDLAESVQLPPADHRPGVLLLEARRRS